MQEQPTSVAANEDAFSHDDFRRTLVYRDAGNPAHVRQNLLNLKELDKAAEAKQMLWAGLIVVPAIVGIISFVAWFFTENSAMIVGIVLGVAGVIVGLVVRARHGRLNLDDRRYTLVSELVRYLATDMLPDGSLDLTIDFNSYRNRRYQTESMRNVTAYSLPWLALKGTLADGNRFRLAATQVVKRKERRKRKYTKVKEAFREKISLTIITRTKRYTGLERVVNLMQLAKLPPGIQVQRVINNADRIHIQSLTDSQLRVKGRYGTVGKEADQLTSDHHTMLGLFVACYHCLAQCRRRKKGA